MTITLNITKAELTEAANVYGSFDQINEAFKLPTIGYKEHILMALGKDIEKNTTFCKTIVNRNGMSIEVDVPENITVAVLDIYAELIKQTVPPVMALITALKINVEPKVNKLAELIEEHASKK